MHSKRLISMLGVAALVVGACSSAGTSRTPRRSSPNRCERSIALRPNNHYAYKGLGLCLARLGEVDAGIRALEHSIQLNPTYFDSRHDLALVLIEIGRIEQAKEQLAQAVKIAPEREPQVRAILKRLETK